MCFATACFSGFDFTNFEITPVVYMTKNTRQKFHYLENKKSFQHEIKNIFHHFKVFLVAEYCLRS